jgi:hypothetical protein
MSIRDYSKEELTAELKRREKLLAINPIPMDEIDWQPVVKMVTNTVGYMTNEGYAPKDFEHYIFEAAMEAVYGKDVWDWYNPLINSI